MVSNHCTLLVKAGGMSREKSSFKFENMWLKVEGFVEQVRCWWNRYHFARPPSYVLDWNKHVFGDMSFRKKMFVV